MHKLNKIDLSTKMANIISKIYQETHTSIIYKDQILPKITTNKGVKQGDNLSTAFFKINDLPKKLEE